MHVDLESGIREDLALFSETQSRILLTVAPQNLQQVEMLMQAQNVPCERIGVVMPGRFDVALNGRFVIQEELPGLQELWENALETIMSSEDHVIPSSPVAA